MTVLVFTAGGGYGLYNFISKADKPQKRSTTPSYRLQIGVFQFYGMAEGKPALSISADSLIVRKKKIGPFSFSPAKTASMENVRIAIYADQVEGKTDFTKAFSKETFKSFPVSVGNISALEARNIQVTLYINEIVATEIQASAASLRLNKHDILFEGSVRVTSGPATLLTDSLSFSTTEKSFQTNKPFTLLNGKNRLRGEGLMTDIYLRPLEKPSGAENKG